MNLWHRNKPFIESCIFQFTRQTSKFMYVSQSLFYFECCIPSKIILHQLTSFIIHLKFPVHYGTISYLFFSSGVNSYFFLLHLSPDLECPRSSEDVSVYVGYIFFFVFTLQNHIIDLYHGARPVSKQVKSYYKYLPLSFDGREVLLLSPLYFFQLRSMWHYNF